MNARFYTCECLRRYVVSVPNNTPSLRTLAVIVCVHASVVGSTCECCGIYTRVLWDLHASVVGSTRECCGIYTRVLWDIHVSVVGYTRECCGIYTRVLWDLHVSVVGSTRDNDLRQLCTD